MRLPSKTLAALVVAGSIPLLAGSVAAAPIGQSQGLKNADLSAVEQVQFRRRGYWRGGRWIGPAAGVAAGVAIGSALAPRYYDGYYAYGAAPIDSGYYAYGAAPGYVGRGFGVRDYGPDAPAPGSSARCTNDPEANSAYPSWMCR